MTKIGAYFGLFVALGSVMGCGGSSSPSASNGGANGEAGTSAAGKGQSGGNGQSGSNGSSGAGGSGVGPQAKSDKLDVLFVVDNSSSMAGKQKLLAASLPSFVARLAAPPCVGDDGRPIPGEALFGGCAMGKREASPVSDIHFGVITTSLGGHGGNVVCMVDTAHHNDDQARQLQTTDQRFQKQRNQIGREERQTRAALAAVKSPKYAERLKGTIGVEPRLRP